MIRPVAFSSAEREHGVRARASEAEHEDQPAAGHEAQGRFGRLDAARRVADAEAHLLGVVVV